MILSLMTIFVGCSTINKMAIRTTANVVEKGSDELLTEGNWEFFKASAPGNIKLLEGLWFADQENERLLGLLVKGHAAYAFAVHETIALEDILLERSSSSKKEQAILHYEKALYYGTKFLSLKGITSEQFFAKDFSVKLAETFNKKMNDDDLVALFYFAQALGSSINLQRDNVSKMGYLSHVKSLLNWVCKQKPDLERGSCGLFQSVIEASTPTLLGGSQERAKTMFQKVMDSQPYNLMARLSYIQYHLIPMLEEDEFEVQMATLKKNIKVWYAGIKDNNQKVSPFKNKADFNLFNAMAKRRFESIAKVKKEIF